MSFGGTTTIGLDGMKIIRPCFDPHHGRVYSTALLDHDKENKRDLIIFCDVIKSSEKFVLV